MEDATEKLPVTVTVTAEPLPSDWTVNDSFDLARELAPDHSPAMFKQILIRNNLTEGQFATLQTQPVFRAALIGLVAEYNKIASTQKRIQLRTQLGYEAALPTLIDRISDPKEPLAAVAQMTKVIADVGALSKPEATPSAGEKITITLDFGADTRLTFEKTAGVLETLPDVGEGAIDVTPVQSLPKGAGSGATVRPDGEGN